MKVEMIFPTPVYYEDIGSSAFNKYLEDHILKWKDNDKGITRTNVNGWHSEDNMHQMEIFKPLVEDLYKFQNLIYREEKLSSEPILGNMWANVNPPGGFNRPHIHPNSLWSGVYYVKTPSNCGDLKIEDPRTLGLMYQPKREEGENDTLPKHSWREIHFNPIAGRCIMFPSWVNHCVDPNQSNDFRISISFNFLQKGMYL